MVDARNAQWVRSITLQVSRALWRAGKGFEIPTKILKSQRALLQSFWHCSQTHQLGGGWIVVEG